MLGQAPPTPVLGTGHQVGPQCVSLHVPAGGRQVLIPGDGEGLEPPLVDVAGAGRLAVRMPSLRVRERQPAHEARELPIPLGPEHQVEVVRHHAVGKQPRPVAPDRLAEDTNEGVVVSRVLKDPQPAVGAIQGMIDDTAFGGSKRSSHPPKLTALQCHVNITVPDTLSVASWISLDFSPLDFSPEQGRRDRLLVSRSKHKRASVFRSLLIGGQAFLPAHLAG